MLDIRFIVENETLVREKLRYRLKDPSLLDEVVALDQKRRALQKEGDVLRQEKNQKSKEIGVIKSRGGDASAVMSEVAKLGEKLSDLERQEREVSETLTGKLMMIPNLPMDDVPVGEDETSNQEIRRWGDVPSFSFSPRTHDEIAETLGILDFERGAKIAGSGFTLYRGLGARLERALINFMLDTHREDGYEEYFVPFLIKGSSLEGTGQLPKFKEDLYHIEGEDLYLNPTAEVPLTNIYQNEILTEKDLPRWITAYAPSFRKEAGSYGKDTKGIIRQHQFNKVELVKICRPEDSEKEHQQMVEQAQKILKRLGLAHRVVVLSQGDMGFSAAKCYDVEVWLPGQNRYREISSVSNCLDFQARRAQIRFRRESTGKLEFVHTLNGSGLAVGRTVVAILENYQQPDGSVVIPEVLRPYMGGVESITKISL
ncbi:serine--tRNA ligase [Thermospira aquatica]|uniref:Serine--tRNA ligase n=1 Tax=Thermospira aquatica TaxID=2828656 RepID=A0AAX3BB13_9SPIR|nr:serine--tRNA ligase [Thermospira aquatica]URA09482.1 serine--tRNA ligase [Thermospira aquatica]